MIQKNQGQRIGGFLICLLLIFTGFVSSSNAPETTGDIEQLIREKRYKQAISECDTILDNDPENSRIRKLKISALRKLTAIELKRTQKEKKALNKAELVHVEKDATMEDRKFKPLQPSRMPFTSNRPFNTEVMEKLRKKITLELFNAPLSYIVDLLFKMTGLNIIADQSILEGKALTVQVVDLPLIDLLEYMSRNEGIEYTVKKNAVWLTTPAQPMTISRVFRLNTGLTASNKAANPNVSGSGKKSNKKKEPEKSDVENLMEWISEWPEWPEGSSYLLDKKMNYLFVRTTPEMMKLVEENIKELDINPMQIMIKVRFVEVTMDTLKELGLSWLLNGDFKLGESGGGEVVVNRDSGMILPTQEFANIGLNSTITGVLTDPEFRIVLHALETSEDTDTLSAPQVTTINNVPAIIKMTQEFPYIDDYDEVSTDYNVDASDGDINLPNTYALKGDIQRRELGITLEVTPSVGRDMDTISLVIHPQIDTQVGFQLLQTLVTSAADQDQDNLPGSVRVPVFGNRELITRSIVSNGETVVIGGLSTETDNTSTQMIPVLGHIPILGKLFRQDSKRKERSSLLIFLTARLLESTGRRLLSKREQDNRNAASADKTVPPETTGASDVRDKYFQDLKKRVVEKEARKKQPRSRTDRRRERRNR